MNLFYQEVEVLRFIDYIIGALYFLNHVEHKHEAVCPENILVDESGKFSLIDATVFQLPTNYLLSMEQLPESLELKVKESYKAKSNLKIRDGLAYLAP